MNSLPSNIQNSFPVRFYSKLFGYENNASQKKVHLYHKIEWLHRLLYVRKLHRVFRHISECLEIFGRNGSEILQLTGFHWSARQIFLWIQKSHHATRLLYRNVHCHIDLVAMSMNLCLCTQLVSWNDAASEIMIIEQQLGLFKLEKKN